jgi:site-specific recombinase XerD
MALAWRRYQQGSLNLVQKWLGHAQLTTTAIYADAVGTSALRRRISPAGCGGDAR